MRYKLLVDINLLPEETSIDFIENVQRLLNGLAADVVIQQVESIEEPDLGL